MSAQSFAHRDDFIFSKDDANYWHPFGLERNPFPTPAGHNAYYPFHQWEEYLDLLQQLSRNNNVLLAVTGPKGAGKSTIMHQFLVQTVHDFDSSEVATYAKLAPGEFWVLLEETLRTCQVRADITLDPERLIDLMTEGFDLPWQSTDTLHEQIDAQIDNLRRSKQTCLLLVDDAHLLPVETLQTLLYMINQQSESEMRFHVLLFGDTPLKSQLNKSTDKQQMEDITCLLDLKPLTREETECYLLHCFKEAGLKGTMPLSHAQIQRIYKQSKGIPGQINQVAQQLLLSSVRRKPHLSVVEWVQEHAPLVLGSGLFVLTAVCLAMFMNNNSFDDTASSSATPVYQQQADTSLIRVSPAMTSTPTAHPVSPATQGITEQKSLGTVAPSVATAAAIVTTTAAHSETTTKIQNPIPSVPTNNANTSRGNNSATNASTNSMVHPVTTLPATIPNAIPLSVSIRNAEQAVLQSNRHPLIVATSLQYQGNTVALKGLPHAKVVAAAVSPVVSSVIEMKATTPEQPAHLNNYLSSQPLKIPVTFAQTKSLDTAAKHDAVAAQPVKPMNIQNAAPTSAIKPVLPVIKQVPLSAPQQGRTDDVLNQQPLVSLTPSSAKPTSAPVTTSAETRSPVIAENQQRPIDNTPQLKSSTPSVQGNEPVNPSVSKPTISINTPVSVTKPMVSATASMSTPTANEPMVAPVVKHTRLQAKKSAVSAKVAAAHEKAHVIVSHTKAERQHLAVNPQFYTLQLVGVSYEAAVIKLMKEQSLGSKASYFHTMRNGKDWYVLTYGHYATPQQALAAKATLPPSIQSLKPWVRKMSSVHQAIKAGEKGA